MRYNRKPFTFRGVTYPSRTAAARALGCSHQNICAMIAAGRSDRVGSGAKKPIAIGGVEYPSGKAAAEALGVSEPIISNIRKSGGVA